METIPRIESRRKKNRSILDKIQVVHGPDVGIDLGTNNVKVYVKGKGIVLHEPAVVAIDDMKRKIIEVGTKAWAMQGRTPKHLCVLRPIRNGVIADYDATEYMVRYFLNKVIGKRHMVKPRMIVSTPAGLTNVEKRAILEATMQAGSRKTVLIEQTLAAALGCGIDQAKSNGNMVIDIGGGTTDMAVLSLSGVVISESLRIGGSYLDAAIIRYMKRKKKLLIGMRTAESIKLSIGTVHRKGRNLALPIKGRDTLSGLPKSIEVESKDVAIAIAEPIDKMVRAIKFMLEKTPPELAADIADHGIILTGSGARLHGLDRLITRETGMPTYICEDPVMSVAHGLGRALEQINELRDSLEEL